jgi:RNA polymerase sigma factor (sigma-70 family)
MAPKLAKHGDRQTYSSMQPLSKYMTHDNAGKRLLYEEYYGKLLKIAFRYVTTYEQAQEVTHNGFLEIFQGLPRLANDKSVRFNTDLSKWINRIFITSIVEQMKSKPALQVPASVPEHLWNNIDKTAPEAQIMSIELIKILKGLTAYCRIIFNLYIIDGFSHEEIAKILGITTRHSKYFLTKARRYSERAINLLFQTSRIH